MVNKLYDKFSGGILVSTAFNISILTPSIIVVRIVKFKSVIGEIVACQIFALQFDSQENLHRTQFYRVKHL